MLRFPFALLLPAVLAGCAAAPEKQAATDEARCTTEPPTGSLVVRGQRCVVTTDAERDAQRRALEQMRQQQEMQRRPVGGGAS